MADDLDSLPPEEAEVKVVSFFAGVGGFDLAFRQAGHEVVGACEIDKFARKVYATRLGEPTWFPSDINEVTPDAIPEADVWCGGFPCQDLSVAGKRAGFVGKRSGLVWRWLDLAAVRRPRWILMENVPGMLSVDGGRGFGRLVARLDDIGYVGAWTCLDARHFGLAQRRSRIFILACRAGVGDPAAVLALAESRVGNPAQGGATTQDVAGTLGGGASESGGWRCGADEAAGGRLVVGDVATGINLSGLRGRQPGSAATYVVGAIGASNGGADDNDVKANRLVFGGNRTSGEREVAAALSSHGGPHGRLDFETENFVADVSPTLNDGDMHDKRQTTVVAYNVHAAESGARERHAYETDHARSLDSAGGFAPAQGGTIVAGFNMKAESGSHGGNGYTKDGSPPIRGHNPPATIGANVRRLTPTECERLQGFPDGWTCRCGAAPYSTAACRCPDGNRYRALGNAVAVPVVEWIARRLASPSPFRRTA